ncbi:MATE family efflux transporter [Alkalihalobacillus oceani]|uniref:MATE family efflux transporter n=1 Tax=Halalkalibacter oceani TaxID=1653776 RepID=UPI00204130B6|nr:MATE family efflux transporter [Halalkalibacter oceani]MCM3763044.1 MATE family efflux transporter [Halalkalibacter oceani]
MNVDNHRLKSNKTLNEKIKITLLLALPAVIENFFQQSIGFVDTYFVSKIGLVEVSAVGVTNALLAIYFAIFMAIGVAVNVYVSNFLGANKIEKARHIAQQAVVMAFILGVLSGLTTLFFAEPLLRLMGITPDVLAVAAVYFRIVAIPSFLMSLTFVFSSILRGSGNTKAPMIVSIVINIFHVLLDFVLIFGFAFIPALGIVGAAWATVIARLIGVVGLYFYITKSKLIFFKKEYWKIDWGHQWELVTLGSPAAGERLVMRAGQIVYFGLIVALGTNSFAAHQIAGNIEVLSYMIGYGFATAATILVGQQVGAHKYEEAKSYAQLCTFLSVSFMAVLGIFLFFLGEWIGSFFTNDPEVINDIKIALQISGLSQPFLAIVLVLTGAFQGANNTKFPMYLTAVGMWGVRTLFIYILGLYLGWGLGGVWLAIGLDILFKAIVLWMKFTRGKWISTKTDPKRDPESECHPQSTKENMSCCVNNY